jgi:hypothetical protein
MFGGEKFVPIIGHISLARDMKTALQEADEVDADGNPKEVLRDAKGKEILSPEEKARREEKERKAAAEVSWFSFAPCSTDWHSPIQKAAARKERVDKLVENLERKLAIFAEQAQGPEDLEVGRSWRTICKIEAE